MVFTQIFVALHFAIYLVFLKFVFFSNKSLINADRIVSLFLKYTIMGSPLR